MRRTFVKTFAAGAIGAICLLMASSTCPSAEAKGEKEAAQKPPDKVAQSKFDSLLPKPRIYVSIVEMGPHEVDHSRTVLGKMLEGITWVKADSTIDEKLFQSLIESYKYSDETTDHLKNCLKQHTLWPTGGEPAHLDTSFAFGNYNRSPLQSPVAIGQFREGDLRILITLKWQQAGKYAVAGGPAVAITIPECQLEVTDADGKTKSDTFKPEMKSSYKGAWPIDDVGWQIRSYVVRGIGQAVNKQSAEQSTNDPGEKVPPDHEK